MEMVGVAQGFALHRLPTRWPANSQNAMNYTHYGNGWRTNKTVQGVQEFGTWGNFKYDKTHLMAP